jgi:hypothetical protein
MGAMRVVSPSKQKDFFCDEAGARAVIELYRRDRQVELQAEPQPSILFDGGGACLVGEPQVNFEAGGLSCSTPVTQFETTLSVIEAAKEYKGCGSVAFGGWMGFYYVISLATRDLLVQEMKRLWPSVEPRVREWQAAFDRAMSGVERRMEGGPA